MRVGPARCASPAVNDRGVPVSTAATGTAVFLTAVVIGVVSSVVGRFGPVAFILRADPKFALPADPRCCRSQLPVCSAV